MSHTAAPVRTKSVRKLRLKAPTSAPRSARRPDIHPLDRAITELRSELARLPDDATLHARLGALHYRRGDLMEAERYYRRAVELQPNRAAFHNNLGNVLCDLGRMTEGISSYEAAMSIEKNLAPNKGPSAEAETNLELARLEYRLVHERIEYLERAVQLDVGSAEALNALGGGYLLRNQRGKALEAFRKAVKLDSRNAYAVKNLAFTHTLDLTGAGDLTGALAELAEGAVRFPHEARLFIHQGELLEAAGLLEEAEEKYRRALKADPRNLECYDLLGRLREVLGAGGIHDAAAREADALLARIEREADAWRKRAGDQAGPAPLYDLAFAAIARARFACKPCADTAALDAMLRECMRLAELGNGREQAVAVNAALLRVQLLEAEGRRDEAVLVLEGACERWPQAGKVWFERGGLALRMGEIALAVEAFERGTLAEPQEAYAYHSLRFAFEGYRRYRTERVRFEAAKRANPNDALAHHHLALAALSVLKDDEALFHFTRAFEFDPRLSEAACGRARVLQRQGHLQEALAAYEKALAADPHCAEAERALALLRSGGAPDFSSGSGKEIS